MREKEMRGEMAYIEESGNGGQKQGKGVWKKF